MSRYNFLYNLDWDAINSTEESRMAQRMANLQHDTELAFPVRLYGMLEADESNVDPSIVSWTGQGTAFRVHKPAEFVKAVLPKYFNQQTQFRSFQRQLNTYSFERISKGPLKGSYRHAKFIRGKNVQVRDIHRGSPPTGKARPVIKKRIKYNNGLQQPPCDVTPCVPTSTPTLRRVLQSTTASTSSCPVQTALTQIMSLSQSTSRRLNSETESDNETSQGEDGQWTTSQSASAHAESIQHLQAVKGTSKSLKSAAESLGLKKIESDLRRHSRSTKGRRIVVACSNIKNVRQANMALDSQNYQDSSWAEIARSAAVPLEDNSHSWAQHPITMLEGDISPQHMLSVEAERFSHTIDQFITQAIFDEIPLPTPGEILDFDF